MFEVNVVEKTSKKTGNGYTVLEIVFPNGYKKICFLDKAEEYIARQYIEA